MLWLLGRSPLSYTYLSVRQDAGFDIIQHCLSRQRTADTRPERAIDDDDSAGGCMPRSIKMRLEKVDGAIIWGLRRSSVPR